MSRNAADGQSSTAPAALRRVPVISRRRVAVRVLAGSVLLVAGYGIAREFAAVHGPKLILPQYPLHLGEGKPGETLRGRFDLFNGGDRPLDFTIAPHCQCTELRPKSGTIPPGGSQRIGLAVRLPSHAGTSRAVNISITTNDRSQEVASYLVTAECPLPFVVSPERIDFGDTAAGSGKSLTLEVTRSRHRGAPSLDGLTWDLSSQVLSVEQTEATDESVALTVLLPSDAPRGALNGTLTIRTSGGDSMDVPITGSVVGPLLTAPASLRMPRSADAAVKVLVWRPGGEPLGPATRISAPAEIIVSEVTPIGGGVRRVFAVRYDRDAGGHVTTAVGDEPYALHFHFDGIDEPVVVQVQRHVAVSSADKQQQGAPQ